MPDVDSITQQAKGIALGKKTETVAKSTYSLRSASKGSDVKVTSKSKPPPKGSQKPKGMDVDVATKHKPTKASRGLKVMDVDMEVNSKFKRIKGRRGPKGVDVDVALTKAGQNRKGKEKKTDVGDDIQGWETDTEEACKRFRKGRKHDDEPDKDGAGAAAGQQTTRSSPGNRPVNSVSSVVRSCCWFYSCINSMFLFVFVWVL